MSPNILSTCGFRTALLGSVAGTLALAVLPGQALAATATEIVITGSRIPQKNLITTSPVVTIGSADVNAQGITKVEDLTNSLPQVFAGQNATVSNGSNATATVDLRGLGSRRTLVLMDGKRMPYGSPTSSPAADLNQIPGQLVDRIEVLTGGASAVYGSDALAGVVNFIMKKDYEGLRLDAQYSIYQHINHDDTEGNLDDVVKARGITNPDQFRLPERSVADGDSREISVIAGAATGDNRGHLEGYFTWRKNDPILQANRNFSACSISAASNANPSGQNAANVNYNCGGSATSFPGAFATPAGIFGAFPDATLDDTTSGVTTAFRPFNAALDQYNFGPVNYFQRPDERYSFGAFGTYDLWSGAEFYADLMFTDYQTNAQIAPSGNFFNTTTINCGNPLLSPTQAGQIGCSAGEIAADSLETLYIGRRNVEGGGRQDHRELWSYRTVVGVRGAAWEGWDYDVSAQRSKTTLQQVYRNDFSVTRLKRALDIVDADPGVGVDPQCRSVVNGTDPNCVPYNVFTLAGKLGGVSGTLPGGISNAALAYLQVPLLQQASETQTIFNASVTGDLGPWGFKSPWADDTVKMAFGFEARRDEVHDTVDNSFATGDAAGQGGPTVATEGASDLWELFTELQLPLVQNVWLAKQISIDVGYRYSDYDNHIHTHTYKVGADWAPTDDVRMRTSYSRAVRAPNVIELFAPQAIGLFNAAADPCSGAGALVIGSVLRDTCLATGVPLASLGSAGLNNPAGQYNGLFGGDGNLKPEIGRTLTIGAVFTPTMAPGLVASVDFWDIRVSNAIGATGGVNVFNGCHIFNQGPLAPHPDTGIPTNAQCALIHRNPVNGRVWTGNTYIEQINTNLGGFRTRGVDVNASYTFDFADMGWANVGSLNASIVGTWLDTLITDIGTGAPTYDCAGFYGFAQDNSGIASHAGVGHEDCGAPNPEWRHRFRLTWDTPWHFDITGTWRYYGSVERHGVATSRAHSAVAGEEGKFLNATLEAFNWFDLSGNVHLSKSVVARLGVNNLFDTDPPSAGSYAPAGVVNGNTFPQVYDSFGRYIFGGITVDF